MSLALIKSTLLSLAGPEDQKTSRSFFKTQPGGYAEGDIFIGVKVPAIRKLAKEFKHLSLEDISILISSEINEERLLALLILIMQFPKNSKVIYEFYIKHMAHVNNWNLVDQSAHYIMGAYLADKDRSILYELAKSTNLWERRIAIIATWWFIRNNDFIDTFNIAEKLLTDKHDLIHKATGWMLRETGKRDTAQLKKFLDQYHKIMPRTALRYSIEKLTPQERIKYMAK